MPPWQLPCLWRVAPVEEGDGHRGVIAGEDQQRICRPARRGFTEQGGVGGAGEVEALRA